MKYYLYIILISIAACNSNNIEKENLDMESVILDTISSSQLKANVELMSEDTFFYTNRLHKQIAENSNLDMFKINLEDKLDIVGLVVDEIQYKQGENVNSFLRKNISGLDTIDFNWIKSIEVSTDLRGDDTKIFLFNNGKLIEVK
ncbi:hypothetical protein [Chondrinema litorale]|uniref:hypothetical protein n=1 Tax=Chondrinema litorale TaxID=2994555 RepID=UPI002543D669|nr:hypothetical protein [Chondrinema litorale]UZR93829.1 hypothetical protein OQ292_18440 [Chondrinema litorale]